MDAKYYKCHVWQIESGQIPLDHDCVLKVRYIPGSPLRFDFFTCRSRDSAPFVLSISPLSVVKSVDVIPIKSFNLCKN